MLGIKLRSDDIYYALFKYFWVLVLLPKAVQLVCLGALMCLIWFKSGKEKPLDSFSVLQLIFVFIYGISIIVNTLKGGHETQRIFAAINTWSINLVALLLYHLYRHVTLDPRRLAKYSLINLVILIVLWLVFECISDSPIVIFGHTLSADDWVNGVYTPRFVGYLDYTNLIVFCILFFYPLALYYLRRNLFLSAAMTAVIFFVINSTNSRTGLLLYLIILFAYCLFGLQKSFFQFYRERKFALLSLAVLAVAGIAAALADQILGVLQSLMDMRQDSNSMRFYIYETTLKTMLTESPIIGIGIKDMLGDYPLGSHSTFIGVFYKAGLLGGTLYLISIVFIAAKTFLGKDPDRFTMILKLCLIASLLLMVLEDVDGANWCVCIFYVLLALVQNRKPLFVTNK